MFYYGVFCANPRCGEFIQIGTYEQREGKRDVTPDPVLLTCPFCKEKWVYSHAEIAHSTSPDGKEPVFDRQKSA
jgi:hypothetical protein